jgi:signal transduction protein with GAF and PtsI domain
MSGSSDPISDPARLAALRDADLLDTPSEEVFDQLARLAARLVDAPMALVSLVDSDRQFFKGAVGIGEALATAAGAPLSQSFCRYAVGARAPFIVCDAREHPTVRENPAIQEYGVVAYLGVPLIDQGGRALGTLCVIDSQPRTWTEREVESIEALARTVMATIGMRTSARAAARAGRAPTAPAHQSGPDALFRAAADYVAAVDRYEAVVRVAAESPDQLDQEDEERSSVGYARAVLEHALTRHAAAGQEPGAADGPDARGRSLALSAAALACVSAERDREAAGAAFLEQRIGLDDYQIACAAVRGPEHALRRALADAAAAA